MGVREKLVLVDGNSLVYRAFYALPLMQTGSGEHTNAVYGFTGMILKLIEEQKPTHLAVAFDFPAPTFRHRLYREYKINRLKAPSELKEQIQRVKQLLAALQVPVFEMEGYEADDLIGTLAVKARQRPLPVVVVTGDADLLQLIDRGATVLLTRKGITQMDRFDAARVQEQFGLEPHQMLDYKALTGDPADNIPGVPGIGPKTATRLLQAYGTLEELYRAGDLTGRVKTNLERYREQLFTGRKLLTLKCDLPLENFWEQSRFTGPDPSRLMALFSELEFKTLAERAKKLFPGLEGAAPTATPDRVIAIGTLSRLKQLLAGLTPGARLGLVLQFTAATHRQQGFPEAMALAFKDRPGYYLSEELLAQKAPEILGLLADSLSREVTLVGHDLKTIYHLFARAGHPYPRPAFDLCLAAYLLRSDQGGLDLPHLLQARLGQPLLEPLEGEEEQSGRHLARQAGHLLALAEHLEEELARRSLDTLYYRLELPLVATLAKMEGRGIPIDRSLLKQLESEIGERIEQLEQEIFTLVGEEFNLNSPQQLGRMLFEKLELPVLKKTKTGPSTAAAVLEELAPQHPVVPAILNYRHLIKLKGTYLSGLMELVDPVDHKIYTTFNQAVTATGRLSSSDPNLQNIPVRLEEGRQIRRAFIPSNEDSLFLSADYSQIELRILAHLSQDPILKEAFRQGQDIHRRTAAEVFNISSGEVTPALRDRAKAVNFGIIYGISDYGLSRQLGVPRLEARQYIESYFERYRGVKDYFKQVIDQAKKLGFVSTLLNRRRYLPDINSTNFSRRSFAERMARNTPVQGSAADIIKLAMLRLDRLINEGGFKARLLLQVHDELLFELESSDIDFFAPIIRREMEQALPLAIPLTVDLKCGRNWADLTPLEGV
ncbi:MAG: DNA polymerase I [Firmicutes bacterium]|nr:DNA polymerase I [Bacillota bacterium]